MILIKSVMEKQLDLWEDYKRNCYYVRSISVFSSLLNMSLAVLGRRLSIDEVSKIDKIFSLTISHRGVLKEKHRRMMEECFRDYLVVISEAFDKIEEIIKSSEEYSSELYKTGSFMIEDYMYPEGDQNEQ